MNFYFGEYDLFNFNEYKMKTIYIFSKLKKEYILKDGTRR